MNLSEYVTHDATALADLVRRGEVTAAELTTCAQTALDAVNDRLNLVAHRPEAPVPGNPSGPFAGVPFVIKDLVIQAAGLPSRAGTRMLAAGQFVPSANSELFQRFQDAGLNTIAVTTSPEFGFNAATESALYGATCNPWDPARSPGGSSGGSAAAVAAGVVPVAHANDGGGSIRIPAASCGLVGLKPGRGRVPLGPDNNFPVMGMAVEFAVTRSVRDAAALLDCVNGPAPGEMFSLPRPAEDYASLITKPTRKLRIALSNGLPGMPAPDAPQAAALRATAELLAAQGHEVVEAMPDYDPDTWRRGCYVGWMSFLASGVVGLSQALGITPGPDTVEAATLACAEAGSKMGALDYEMALLQMNAVSRAVGRFMTSHDVILLPTLRHLPVPLGLMNQNDPGIDAEGWFDKVFSHFPYCALFNMTGQPAISLPAGLHEGLPLAVQLVGGMGDEGLLLQLARDLEQARPWAGHRPQVFAA